MLRVQRDRDKGKMDSNSEIRKIVLDLFVQEKLADEWLNTPKWFFDDLTPLEMLQKPEGKEAVLSILERIRYGDFS